MQTIINKIQSGELSQVQLIDELVKFNDSTFEEYDSACDVVELNQKEIINLEAKNNKLENETVKAKLAQFDAVIKATSACAEVLLLKSDNKLLKKYEKDNKALTKLKAKHIKSAQQAEIKNKALIKDCKDYRMTIAKQQSDIARLRLTGFKDIGEYSFTLFPSKISVDEGGKIEQRINLVIMDHNGSMKIIGVNENGEVKQPLSHEFNLNEEQVDFITSFDRIARADNYDFTDRVLSLLN